ncbi:UDP-glycosyltransferase UGT5-like [Ostrinia nubilalis]|uniref:UDP-glycosyltransferase UGT5-like n=1 Tax=Ostrinia nubilalis TaxID=29057 RepID=UPI0030823AF3
MNSLGKYALIALLCFNISEAYNILVVFPMPAQSHRNLGDGVVRHLLNAGHEVTYITPYIKEGSNPKLRQIKMIYDFDALPKPHIKTIMNNEQDFNPSNFFNYTLGTHQAMIQNKEVQKLLRDPQQTFDVVVIEWLFSELYSGLSAVFGCPLIWVSSVDPHSAIMQLIDENLNPAYNPGLMSTVLPPYTFVQRVKELFMSAVTTVLKNYIFVRYERQAYEELYVPLIKMRGRPVPTYDEVKFNASLILGNSHVSLGQATRLPQNYKAVAGYHIDTNFKPLPENLKKLLDSAKNGVIYFSMGSNLSSKDMPEELKKSLLKVFGALKQTVLWKFEEVLDDLPKNVHIVQWAPQPAILSHPNCVLFITHGGLLSATEAVHFGKPIIGIPVFADQFLNVERAVKKGLGKRVDLSYSMADDLEVALKEILDSPRYMERAKELSMIFHDRPTPPGEELAHWVSHVIKTGGAPHLRSPALHTPFYQKMYLDLIAVIVVILIALRILVRRICNSCKTKKLVSDKKYN